MGLGSRCIRARSTCPIPGPIQGTISHHGFSCFFNGRHAADATRYRCHAFSGERLHFGGWLALAASTVGALLIALSSKGAGGIAHASVRGDLLVVISMYAAIAWILISKLLMRQHSAVMVTASVYWIGTLILAFVVITTSGVPSLHYSSRAWVAVAEQGLLALRGHPKPAIKGHLKTGH
jgi:hypothetical protein